MEAVCHGGDLTHCGSIAEVARGRAFGNLVELVLRPFGDLLELVEDHMGDLLELVGDHLGDMLELVGDHLGDLRGWWEIILGM